MGMTDIDLHMHSTASDGTDSPERLLENVKKAGIRTFALTDHDTIEGVLKMQEILGADEGPDRPEFFRGIEFSCQAEPPVPFRTSRPVKSFQPFACHLLGYQYDIEDPAFKRVADKARNMRVDKTKNRLQTLKEYGYEFTQEELDWLWSQPSPGRPMIAEMMLRHGFKGTKVDAMVFIGKVEKKLRVPSEEALEGVLKSGGVTVWAHPLGEKPAPESRKETEITGRSPDQSTGQSADGKSSGAGSAADRIGYQECDRRLKILIEQGIMGIECWYSSYTQEDVNFLLSEADKYHLLVSGGSDYHGKRKNISLGELNSFHAPVNHGQLTVLSELRERS